MRAGCVMRQMRMDTSEFLANSRFLGIVQDALLSKSQLSACTAALAQTLHFLLTPLFVVQQEDAASGPMEHANSMPSALNCWTAQTPMETTTHHLIWNTG